jgi:hypothetical protein
MRKNNHINLKIKENRQATLSLASTLITMKKIHLDMNGGSL